MRNAYSVVNHKKGRAESSTADQCYAFNRFFTEQKSLERHLNCCAHIPRVVYRFENQSIQTFFDDTKFMLICRLPSILILKPLVIKKPTILTMMQAYTLFCTPLWLNLDRTFVVRSFNHTFEQLNDVSYLSDEIIPYFDPITVRQLRDSSQAVFEKREKFSISQMFYRKLKFVIDLLIK